MSRNPNRKPENVCENFKESLLKLRIFYNNPAIKLNKSSSILRETFISEVHENPFFFCSGDNFLTEIEMLIIANQIVTEYKLLFSLALLYQTTILA